MMAGFILLYMNLTSIEYADTMSRPIIECKRNSDVNRMYLETAYCRRFVENLKAKMRKIVL